MTPQQLPLGQDSRTDIESDLSVVQPEPELTDETESVRSSVTRNLNPDVYHTITDFQETVTDLLFKSGDPALEATVTVTNEMTGEKCEAVIAPERHDGRLSISITTPPGITDPINGDISGSPAVIRAATSQFIASAVTGIQVMPGNDVIGRVEHTK